MDFISLRKTLAACLTLCAATVSAQSYPLKPVRVVVPFAAGGNSDRIARAAADSLAKALGQQFLVENRLGAGGAIGTESVAKAAPDGYTLLVGSTGQLAILQNIQKVAYDPLKDLAPISNLGFNSLVLTVHNLLPPRTLHEFVDYVKANPGRVTYASAGNGSLSHFAAAVFAARAGLDMVHVPYKGGVPASNDLLAGTVMVYFGNAPDVVPHAKTGRLAMLAVTSEKRDRDVPDLPPIADMYPGYRTVAWNGLLAPAGTPREIVERLSQEAQKAMKDPQMVERVAQMGITAVGSSAEELAEIVRVDLALYRDAVKAAGIKAE